MKMVVLARAYVGEGLHHIHIHVYTVYVNIYIFTYRVFHLSSSDAVNKTLQIPLFSEHVIL